MVFKKERKLKDHIFGIFSVTFLAHPITNCGGVFCRYFFLFVLFRQVPGLIQHRESAHGLDLSECPHNCGNWN